MAGSVAYGVLVRMVEMEQIVSLIRDHMRAEADAGYLLLRRIPSTYATDCFVYLESISLRRRRYRRIHACPP
jgi:hypothetical protein